MGYKGVDDIRNPDVNHRAGREAQHSLQSPTPDEPELTGETDRRVLD